MGRGEKRINRSPARPSRSRRLPREKGKTKPVDLDSSFPKRYKSVGPERRDYSVACLGGAGSPPAAMVLSKRLRDERKGRTKSLNASRLPSPGLLPPPPTFFRSFTALPPVRSRLPPTPAGSYSLIMCGNMDSLDDLCPREHPVDPRLEERRVLGPRDSHERTPENPGEGVHVGCKRAERGRGGERQERTNAR